ncbi:MAG TPA: hypothetical protein VK956_01505, partial [Verrucomicrobium sp.]|nr:hypothetical protein [Verrucomicrobium sp.]
SYLLRGCLRRIGDALRIHVSLIDLTGSRHLWAENYDILAHEFFHLHDRIAALIANALSLRLDQSALASSRTRHLASLDVYECWLRGMECLQQGTEDADLEARKYFQQALDMDPLYARASGGMSLSHFNEWSCQAWHQWAEKEQAAYDCARQAEALDPNDQLVQVILGRIEQYRRQFDSAATRFERALKLAPNDASTLIQLAACFAYNGNPELGVELSERALVLNPLCPGWYFTFAAIPLFMLKRYEEAAHMAAKGPGLVDTGAYLAAAFAYLGRGERATFFLKEFRAEFLRRITYGREPKPGEARIWLRHVNPYRREEDIAHFLEGVKRAGLDEGFTDPSPTTPLSWPIANAFRKEGDLWTASFDHEVVQMPEVRGYHDLARLLGEPGQEVHCLALAGANSEGTAGRGTEVLDETAKRAYQSRLQEINEDLAEAGAHQQHDRVEKLEAEKDALIAELKKSMGLGGRSRKMGDPAERARTAVTWRIRHAIKKLEGAHPGLARHLTNAVRTGVYCSYMPEKETKWFV